MTHQENESLFSLGKTQAIKCSGFSSEKELKINKARQKSFTYHCHLCCPTLKELQTQLKELEIQLQEKQLHLDRFGVSMTMQWHFQRTCALFTDKVMLFTFLPNKTGIY